MRRVLVAEFVDVGLRDAGRPGEPVCEYGDLVGGAVGEDSMSVVEAQAGINAVLKVRSTAV